MATIGELLEEVSGRLGRAGVVFGHGTDNAWDEAVALVLGVTRAPDDRSSLEWSVSAAEESQIRALLERRIGERMPLPHLLGHCTFAGLEFLIEPGVVIPRSPIAELIGNGLSPWLTRPPATVLDLCTGSGCLGILAAHAFPGAARVHMVDVDPRAVALARRNVALHGLAGRVEVCPGDLFAALPTDVLAAGFDLILSNPPYVDRADMGSLPREYRHEGALGLAGGEDGLDVVRRILDEGLPRLRPGGALVCEVGMSAPALIRAYPDLPFLWPDLDRGGEGVFVLLADA